MHPFGENRTKRRWQARLSGLALPGVIRGLDKRTHWEINTAAVLVDVSLDWRAGLRGGGQPALGKSVVLQARPAQRLERRGPRVP